MAAVLIVHGHPDGRRALAALVTQCGHRVVSAATGQEALWLLDAGQVGLVLLDVTVPDMKGLDVLRAIREGPSTAPVPVVMYGAAGDAGLREHLISRGANDFWATSSFDDGTLRERLKQYLPC